MNKKMLGLWRKQCN